MKNETMNKVTEGLLKSSLLDDLGLKKQSTDELEKVIDTILFEISDCVNPVPAIANDLTVGVLKFLADTLGKNLNDKGKENVELVRNALQTKYKTLVVKVRNEERK